MATVVLKRLSTCFQRVLSSPPFTKYLLATNMVLSAAIDLCGDVIAQRVVEKSKDTNWQRTGRMVVVSITLCVPAHYWYIRLDKWFPLRTRQQLLKKILLDVFAAGPFFLSAFFLGMSKLEGCTWRESVDETKRKFMPTFMFEVAFWPFAQALNFYFLPTSLRLFYVNFTYLIWSVVLSTFKHNDIELPSMPSQITKK